VTAKYAGVQVDFQQADKIEADKSPIARPPALETKEGVLFETNAIARHVARVGKKLYGNNEFEAATVDQWIDFAANEIDLAGAVWVFPVLGLIPNNATAVQKAKGDVRKALEILNKHLLSRTFLVNERVSLADIIVSLSLVQLFEHVLDTGFRKAFPNVQRWAATLYNQPEFLAVTGRAIKFCEKAEAPKDVAPAPAKEEKKKEEKKPAEPKKEAPKKKKEEDDDGEEGADDFGEPKKKNVLDLLPASSFVMDEWKRMYSNEDDTRGVAMKWFWEKLDKAGYSLWFGEYKYNSELAKLFMTCNFVNGYIQRLERLRKYGFGSFVIFGEEGTGLEIATVFLVRGQDMPAELLEAEDTELYAWRKLNADDAADRKLVEDFWCWSGFEGRKLPFNQGKIFK